ncbi:hypothetical protein ACKUSY_15590 [Myroides odoratus]
MKKRINYIVVLCFFVTLIIHKGNAQNCSNTVSLPVQGTVNINGIQVTTWSLNVKRSNGSPNGSTKACGIYSIGDEGLTVGYRRGVLWKTVITFSEPINNLGVLLYGTGVTNNPGFEVFDFFSNGGTVSLSSPGSCYSRIEGNTLYSGDGDTFVKDTGGGIFIISAPMNYTEVTISGIGSHAGSYLTFCKDTLVPPLCGIEPNTESATEFTETGISDIQDIDRTWLTNISNGFIAIASKRQGFVITRVQSVEDIAVGDRVEGMLVYDIRDQCVKLFDGSTWNCLKPDCLI